MNYTMEMSNKVLPLWISANRVKYPHKIAIIDGNKRITYSDLKDCVNKLAGALTSLGVQRGDRVVLLLQNSSEVVISFFAIAQIGAIAVPLNVQYQKQELAVYLRDSHPKVIITFRETVPLLKEVFSGVDKKECTIISMCEEENEFLTYMHFMRGNSSFNESIQPLPGDDVLCQYSSGSTGMQKRIIRTHANLVSEAENFNATVNVTSNDKILCVVPLFHAHGLGNCMLASMYAGATLVIMKDFNRLRVLKTIQEEHITIFPGVPFMFSILADTSLKEDINLSSLRLSFSAGASLSLETFQKFIGKYGVPIRQLYGSTETGSVTINLDENISNTTASVGLPMKNVEVEIFGEREEILKAGEIGDIGIKSAAMIKGYPGLENLNKQYFLNEYFFPLDRGKKDKRGNLYIMGRKSLFINTGGNKVDPSEIEILLGTYPKVKEAVVVGVKGHYGEDVIKAVVVPHDQCNEREIVEFCKGKIADFKLPRIVEFREEIPKSPLGKVLRKYLCEQ